jgi:hypothetical protein
MSTLGIVCTYVGAFILGSGLALGCLIATNRREMKRRAMIARANRLPKVQHYKP